MSKILLIEDDPVLQEMYLEFFSKAGYDVQATPYGKEGLASMKLNRPDLLLLDLMLPDITGFEVLEQMKHNPDLNTIPVIVMSNISADGEDLVKNRGAKSFILKFNTTPEQVIAKVKSILEPSPQ